MSSLPKPKFCDQNWLEMSPMEKGRLCAACQKTIVDFSKMRWTAIEQLQAQNGNSLCGMYSEKQLEYWGREVPAPKVSRFARAVVFVLGLVGLQARAQSGLPADTLVQKLVVKGTVTERSSKGEVDSLTGATIRLIKNGQTINGAVSGLNGEYNFLIVDDTNRHNIFELRFSFLGREDVVVRLKPHKEGVIWYDAQLVPGDIDPGLIFSVTKPTRMQRIKWKFKSIFNKKYRKH